MVANVAATAVPPMPIEAPIQDAPNLVAAVNQRRAANGPLTYNLDAPVFGGGPRPRPQPTVNAQGGIDDPPSLTDAILRRQR